MMQQPESYSIEPLRPAHCQEVARLHISGISTGFISSLGLPFVTALYEAIAGMDASFGFVCRLDTRIVGFISFTSNVNTLFKFVVRHKSILFFRILLKRVFSLSVLKKIVETLRYPNTAKRRDLPDAELLSIAVASEGRGKGIARQLIDAGFEECRKRGIEKVKVLVAQQNSSANNLYQKVGFEDRKSVV